jgi:hypothetical protein
MTPWTWTWTHPTYGVSIEEELLLLSNDRYLALFHAGNGALIGLTDRLYGMEFLRNQGGGMTDPLAWMLGLGADGTAGGGAQTPIDQAQTFYSYTPSQVGTPVDTFDPVTGELQFEWKGPSGQGIDGALTVRTIWSLSSRGSEGLHARLFVTPDFLAYPDYDRNIVYVNFPTFAHLGRGGTDLVVPQGVLSGGLGRVMRDFTGSYGFYNLLTSAWLSQFFGLVEGNSALYVAMEDPEQHPKQMYFQTDGTSVFRIYPETTEGSASQNIDLGYDAVLTPMCIDPQHGDFARIAKRYRKFALGGDSWLTRDQPFEPVENEPAKLSSRTDIPERVSDGLFWWHVVAFAYNQWDDWVALDRDGRNDWVREGSTPRQSLIQRDVGGGQFETYHTIYRDQGVPVASEQSAETCFEFPGPTSYYVYEGNPSPPGGQRIVVDLQDQSWELLGGRTSLDDLFVIDAGTTKNRLVNEALGLVDEARGVEEEAIPVGIYVNNWHLPGFDKGCPTYDMIPGINAAIAEIRSATCPTGLDDCNWVAPYVNAWNLDITDLDWSAGDPADPEDDDPGNPTYGKDCKLHAELAVQEDLVSPYATGVLPSSGQVLARFSPGSSWWRAEIGAIAGDVASMGARGILLDTYGSGYYPTFTSDGGDHLPGRGDWHTERHREVGARVRSAMTNGYTQPAFTMSEHGSEAYLANIDAVGLWRVPSLEDARLMPLIYSGYQMYLGPLSSTGETPLAHATKVGKGFVYGQLAMSSTYALPEAEGRDEKIDYWRELAVARLSLKDLLAYGEYLGPADGDMDDPGTDTVTVPWCEKFGCTPLDSGQEYQLCNQGASFPNWICVTVPAIRGGRWQSEAGERAIVLTNTNDVEATAEIPVPANWSDLSVNLCAPDDSSCTSVTLTEASPGVWSAQVTIPAREVRALRFQ